MNILTYFEKVIETLNSKPYHVLSKSPAVFYLISKDDGVVSGINETEMFLNLFDLNITLRKHKQNGQTIKRGDIVCSLHGPTDSMYHSVEVVKFILGKMTGIASMVSYYQSKLAQPRVIDLGYENNLTSALERTAFIDGGAATIDCYLVDEIMVDLSDSLQDAYMKARLVTNHPIALEVADIQKYYDALETKAEILILKYFNDEAIRRAILDNKDHKTLIVGGLILPNRLDIISGYQFDYLNSTLFYQASRIYDFVVKIGN